jgi:predicted RNA polymerase sigma factor
MITLNRAVAVAMVRGAQSGLDLLATLDDRIPHHHRLHAVRAHLLEMAGDAAAARNSYQAAARRTTSLPEQRYLEARAAQLTHDAVTANGKPKARPVVPGSCRSIDPPPRWIRFIIP